MEVIHTIREFKQLRGRWHHGDIALVPTMGALHSGHLALIRAAGKQAARVVVSLFVNPLQFGPNEDFSRYPRTLEQDLAACEAEDVDAVFVPDAAEMYPTRDEATTLVTPPAWLTERLCGLARPGHFTGVATVVLKLFNITQPHLAVFGEKDAQQLAVIRQMVRDLDLPITIVGHPTVREQDGLALSSRNRYLAEPGERQAALALYQILIKLKESAGNSTEAPDFILSKEKVIRDVLQENPEAATRLSLEYVEAVDALTFKPTASLSTRTRVLIAGKVGETRLIDNMLMS